MKITPSPHDLYILGYFHVLQGYLQRNYFKRYQSTDCFLKLENIKEESLVIVYQHDTVNMCLWLVHTARHAWRVWLIWTCVSWFRYAIFSASGVYVWDFGWSKRSRNKVTVEESVVGILHVFFEVFANVCKNAVPTLL